MYVFLTSVAFYGSEKEITSLSATAECSKEQCIRLGSEIKGTKVTTVQGIASGSTFDKRQRRQRLDLHLLYEK